MKLITVVVFLFLVGCGSSMTQKMNSQIGVTTVQDALVRWGAPVSERKTDDGGTTMVWASRSRATYQPQYVPPRGPTYGAAAGVARGGLTQARSAEGSVQERGETLTVHFDQGGVMQRWDYQRH